MAMHRGSFLDSGANSVDRRMRPRPNTRINLETLMCDENRNSSGSSSSSRRSSSPNHTDFYENIPELPETPKDDETVKVCLRLRPHLKNKPYNVAFRIHENTLLARTVDETSTERKYTFSEIFNDNVSQAEVYDRCIKPAIRNIMGDRGATFLTYGTSGSGKTYTLLGNNKNPGIVPRAIEQIFQEHASIISPQPSLKIDKTMISFLDDDTICDELQKVETLKQIVQNGNTNHSEMKSIIQKEHSFGTECDPNVRVFIWVSFVEIYNENVYDLLALESIHGKRKPLKILSNEGNAYVKDLSWVYAGNSEDAYSILQFGLQSATYGSTDVNRHSSRSHSIFSLTIVSYSVATQHIKYSVYKFCDLAGSERFKKTGTVGERFKEAQKINTSLMVLGRCLETVHKNQKSKKLAELVPVRDSKLTMFIQSALFGKEKLTMLVNLYPTEEFYDENLNVLNFSSIAKQIVLQRKPTRKNDRTTRYSFFLAQAVSSPSSKIGNPFMLENERLKQEISVYKEQIAEKGMEVQLLKRELLEQELQLRNELTDDFESYIAEREETFKTRLKQAQEASILPYKFQISNLNAKIEHLRNVITDMEFEEDEYEKKIKAYEEQLSKVRQKESRNRRLSL
ncbi:kinesin-like protein subito [Toxorhynchites rutilus septentrionalis]|uniref:kinesin-like protein subito n=1 Tax=Toxorhynchites rutilus septentrionalis TaxID=329112 RepID=UPI002478661B|nr:kinesin-like protein subito [Toxorhynchites rutilus septentrionalis]